MKLTRRFALCLAAGLVYVIGGLNDMGLEMWKLMEEFREADEAFFFVLFFFVFFYRIQDTLLSHS